MTWEELLEALKSYYGETSFTWQNISHTAATPEQFWKYVEEAGIKVTRASDGTVLSYGANPSVLGMTDIGSAVDSNSLPAVTNAESVSVPINAEVVSESAVTNGFLSGASTAVNFVTGTVLPDVAAVSAGITLGKTIDKALYEANPDFWDEHGMSSINPDTWASITADDDSLNAKVFNHIFKIDQNTGKTQQYMDENELAYLTEYLKQKGAFNNGKLSSEEFKINDKITIPANLGRIDGTTHKFRNNFSACVDGTLGTYDGDLIKNFNKNENVNVRNTIVKNGNNLYFILSSNNTNINLSGWGVQLLDSNDNTIPTGGLGSGDALIQTYENKSVAYHNQMVVNADMSRFNLFINPVTVDTNALPYIGWALWYGSWISESPIDGIGTQYGAETPDLSNATTVDEVLYALKEQYPDLWTNAITQNIPQPDGTYITRTYVPVGTPEFSGLNDTQPVSGTSSQTDPSISTKTLPIGVITTPPTTTTPTDTGTGETPIPVVPVGTSKALFAIYNPTQAELDSFGSWLWSSDFVEQLKKIFNDPMQSIIGLHKVFVTPPVSGASTIKVGYLDSGVSSNVVGQQYTTIDMGSVNLPEYFGNVFDYEPFTSVNLYLPFIGIVKLNVADVMRSTIHVVYHGDVITGACLAEVTIQRDGKSAIMYTYAGNLSVQYPLSSGSYMGIISSTLGIAGSIAGTVMSGGAMLPTVLGAGAHALRTARAEVERSGGFSGNAGAMGYKYPYLIITRPQSNLAVDFPTFEGKPTNYTTYIKNCSGYTEVRDVHVEGIPATDSELTEIENLLKSGILV